MTGDDVLNAVACSMQSLLRVEDLVARYGGDEFSAILGGCELEQATVVAERMRRHVMALRLPGGATVSIGLAVVDVTRADAIMHALEAADHALYQSKGRGRNRVSVAEEEDKEPEMPSVRIEASSRV
jgi:two-component system cell cycle response regulator